MAIYLDTVSHDKIFAALPNLPIIVNHLLDGELQNREFLDEIMSTKYTDEVLPSIPSCNCGLLTGGSVKGQLCRQCNTRALPVTEKDLKPILWLETPEGIDTFITPIAWHMLNKGLTFGGVSLLEWLCNPLYRPPNNRRNPKLEKLMKLGIKRSLNNFYRNFDDIINQLLNAKIIRSSTRSKQSVIEWINLNRDNIFSEHQPLPNRSNFIKEATSTTTYISKDFTLAVDALSTFSMLCKDDSGFNQKKREAYMVKYTKQLYEYYDYLFGLGMMARKEGWFRRHIYGSRLPYTARAVITSLTCRHSYDELKLPWGLSLALFKVHITSKLLKRRKGDGVPWNPLQIESLIITHYKRYHPLLDEILQELIEECPDKGIPVLFQRNPTLKMLSAQLFFVTEIKTNPRDISISLPILAVRPMNADFDGDELNLKLMEDQKKAREARALMMHRGVMSLSSPRQISGDVWLSPPLVSTISNWLNCDDL